MKFKFRTIRTAVITTLFIVVLVFGLLQIEPAGAQTQPLLNFIGKVTNLDGTEINDGVYDFTFRLFAIPSGGTPAWSETSTTATRFSATVSLASPTASGMVYTYLGASATSTLRVGQYLSSASSSEGALIVDYNIGANTITVASSTETWSAGASINNRPFVEGGVINENLGVVTDLSGVDFSQTLYLEIIFNGETMSPRKLLTTVPAAFDTTRLGGKTESEYATLSEDEAITGEWSFNNIVSISTSSSNTALTVTQSGTGNIVEFKIGATTSFAVLDDGRVQIGNYRFPTTYGSPGYVLKTNASGDLYWEQDLIGGFGGSGMDFLWATNTAETLIHPYDTADVVVIGNIATSTLAGNIFEVHGASLFDTVNISNQQELRFYDADSSNYIAWRASSSISSNLVLTLPDSYGAPNSALLTDGSGNLTWGSPSSYVYVNPGVTGQMAYYASDGSTLSATSSIYLSTEGYFGVGTTTPSQLLSVGQISGSQFLINATGTVLSGTWQGNMIGLEYGGTGVDLSGDVGFLYVSGGVTTASSSIHIGNTDLAATLPLSLTGNMLSINTAGNWTGTLDGLDSTDFLTLANWFGTSSAPHLTSLANLSTIGTITTGIWSADTIAVSRGGTGQTSWIADDIIYATGATTLGQITKGNPGYLLMVNTAGSGYTWVSSSSAGVDTWRTDEEIRDVAGAQVASGTDSLITVTYNDATDDILFTVQSDLNQYDNSISKFFSTTTDMLQIADGGTGQSAWAQYAIPYMTNTDTFGEITIGAATYVLAVNSGGTGYEWVAATSTGVDTWLSQEEVEDYAGALVASTSDIHSLITITYNDASSSMNFIVEDDLSQYIWTSIGTIHLTPARGGTGWNTSAITGLPFITAGTWGTTTLAIAYGGTGASTAADARINLDLDEVYRFSPNSTGTDGWLWQSGGDGRGQWVATGTLGLGGSGNNETYAKLIGTTSANYDGGYATTTLIGYAAGNAICGAEFNNSFMCRTYDILVTIEQDDISQWSGSAWIAEGPPGYTSNSNDCNGWTSSSTTMLGAFWMLDSNGGGAGWLTNCSETKPIACCVEQ